MRGYLPGVLAMWTHRCNRDRGCSADKGGIGGRGGVVWEGGGITNNSGLHLLILVPPPSYHIDEFQVFILNYYNGGGGSLQIFHVSIC